MKKVNLILMAMSVVFAGSMVGSVFSQDAMAKGLCACTVMTPKCGACNDPKINHDKDRDGRKDSEDKDDNNPKI